MGVWLTGFGVKEQRGLMRDVLAFFNILGTGVNRVLRCRGRKDVTGCSCQMTLALNSVKQPQAQKNHRHSITRVTYEWHV